MNWVQIPEIVQSHRTAVPSAQETQVTWKAKTIKPIKQSIKGPNDFPFSRQHKGK